MKCVEIAPELWNTKIIGAEYFVYSILKRKPIMADCSYIAAPWGRLIGEGKLDSIGLVKAKRAFTVCEYVDYRKLLPLFNKMGIDTLFSPQADRPSRRITIFPFKQIKILPFLHYPVHGPNPSRDKDILYSFIGYDSTSLIGSPLRRRIFEMKHPAQTYIRERKCWHWAREFEWAELSEQEQALQKKEYMEVLARSRFSLCPRGTGISTIRFWESLQAGAIPVLLSDRLILPEVVNWKECLLRIPEAAVATFPEIIYSVSPDREASLRDRCLEVSSMFSGDNFVRLIRQEYERPDYNPPCLF